MTSSSSTPWQSRSWPTCIPAPSLASPTGSLGGAHLALLNVRTELHRVSGRGRELLLAQHADEIGAALRIGDRFDLARTLSDAARTISYYVDAGLRTAANALPRRGFAALRRPVRRPLDEGVIEYAGEVILARDARPERDPGLILRVAAASATTGLPLSASTLSRLAASAPELRTPWPRQAVKDLLVLLAAGPSTVATIEALDRTGLWGRLFPEWGAVRDLPPRDVVHIWTVDRHLVETASRASAFTTRVSRPDLLVLGALVHDIGKGRGGDHSVIGAELATQIGNRLGLWPSDVELLSKVVRYHLLLPDTATRRDLQDPKTIASVVDALGGDPVLLELLHTLAEADSLATGPGVWGDWKASLIGDLVRRCRLVMSGEPLPQPDPIDPRYLSLASEVGVHVELTPGDSPHIYNVTMIAPDRRGLLSKAAGVLALNSLRVHSASVNSHEGSAINTFVVSPHFGSPPAAELLRQQFILALDGELDVIASLQRRDRDAALQGTTRVGEVPAAVPINPVPAPPRVLWFDGTSPGELVVQIRTTDRAGLLAMLTAVFERDGVDIAWAKVTTLGSSVLDAFCIVVPALALATRGVRTAPRCARNSSVTCTRCCRRPRPRSRFPKPARLDGVFESLSDRLTGALQGLRGKGRLTDADIDATAREIRLALLEADVSLPVVREFVARIKERAKGAEVSGALNPAQQVVKIVNEELIGILGGETRQLAFAKTPPTVIMLAGLQGSGKTTLAGKLAKWLRGQGHTPLLVAADLQRPGAVNQLQIVGERAGVDGLRAASRRVVGRLRRRGSR